MAANILNVTEAAYHADPCDRPSLSHSIAHTLVSESPRHAWIEHPRLGGNRERVSTRAMDDGAILHRLLLGEGAGFEMVMADDWRTKLRGRRSGAMNIASAELLECSACVVGSDANAKVLARAFSRRLSGRETTADRRAIAEAIRRRVTAEDAAFATRRDCQTREDRVRRAQELIGRGES